MTLLTAGIDELGTERQLLEGWSYFVIENELLDEFSQKANELLNGIAIDSFHGKSYKRRYKDKYLQFLKLVREYVEKSEISLVGVVLQNEKWKSQYIPFTKSLIKNVYGQNKIDDTALVATAQMLISPLFTLQHLTNSLSSEYGIQITVDSHSVTQGFSSQTIQVSNSIGSTIMTSNQLLNVIYNGYREHSFPNSPTLIENGISVVSDGESFLVQAADIMGNFSLSYLKKRLGEESNMIMEKSEIFSEVFGDVFNNKYFENEIEISETGEINLKFDGQQKLIYGRYE